MVNSLAFFENLHHYSYVNEGFIETATKLYELAKNNVHIAWYRFSS